MNKKRVLYVLSGMMLLLILAIPFYFSTFIQPKIVFTSEIKTVDSESYKRILYNQQVTYPDKDIERFKHITIQIKVTEPVGVNNHVKIERDILLQYLKDKDIVQILGGGSFEHGNGKEYDENINIYLINSSVDQLINELEDFRYKVTWKSFWNKENDKIFYLKDYLNLR
ncbi:MAG: hypothetical protein E7212_08065 [Clostridium sartagoforme]|nr:hypothetical protein [Clostridium sartagoforme]